MEEKKYTKKDLDNARQEGKMLAYRYCKHLILDFLYSKSNVGVGYFRENPETVRKLLELALEFRNRQEVCENYMTQPVTAPIEEYD